MVITTGGHDRLPAVTTASGHQRGDHRGGYGRESTAANRSDLGLTYFHNGDLVVYVLFVTRAWRKWSTCFP